MIYTSVKEEKNMDLLYKYMVHKIYDFQFTTPALVVEKDTVFMWDLLKSPKNIYLFIILFIFLCKKTMSNSI